MVDKKSKSNSLLSYFHEHIQTINNSKIFAGIMIIILNISSRFVNIKLSKTIESYLKHSFSKQILVFAIAWMGSRDIYIALTIAILFIILTEFILNEESSYCCLSESFQNYHLNLDKDGDGVISKDEIEQAQKILEKIAKQQK